VPAFLVLLVLAPLPLRAQVTAGLRLGAVGSTALARDSIVAPVTARQNIAPLVGLRVEIPLRGVYRVAGELDVSRSNLMSRSDVSQTVVTGLTTWQPTIAVRVPATPWLTGEARLSAIMYAPSRKTGTLFSAGAPIRPALGLGITAARSLGRSWNLAVALQYDIHRFTTTALRARGFVDDTVVHRVGLLFALSHRMDHPHAAP
jgi:hypothetical protein